MVKPPVVEATFASGILLIAAGFYGTRYLINHSGSDIAKLAIDTNSECLSLNVTSDSYANCTYRLQKLVNNLTESGEIQLENCELDEADNNIAYCPVWVWYFPQWLPLTDITVVGIVGGRTDRGSIRPSPRLEKILSDLGEASRQLTDLSDRGKFENVNKLESILSSKTGILEQLSDLSYQGKDELSSDELAQIFSILLQDSQDLIEELDKGKLTLNKRANSLPEQSLDLSHLIDKTTDIIPQEMKQMASRFILDDFQESENVNDNFIIKNLLQILTQKMDLSKPELLKDFAQVVNPSDIGNSLKQSNLIETLTQYLKEEDIENLFNKLPLAKSLVSNIPVETSFNKLGLLNMLFQNLEIEDVEDILYESGLIEALVHHVTTTYLDEAFDKSDIEQALSLNLKTNPFFENTLKSGIIEGLIQNLRNNDNHDSYESFGFLFLLASSLEVKGLDGPLDQSLKLFLQNLKTDDIQALFGKSDIIAELFHHLETNLLAELHQTSDLEQALEENLKTNHYIEKSQKPDIMKRLIHKPETEDEQTFIKNLGLTMSQDFQLKNIQNPFTGLQFLKFVAPSLDPNVLENPINQFNLMKSIFQNINIADVEGFLTNSGIMEYLAQQTELNSNTPIIGQSNEQDGSLNHNIENSLISYILKGGSSNSKTKYTRDSAEKSGLIDTITQNIVSNFLKDYDLPGILDLVQPQVDNTNTNNHLKELFKTSLLKTLIPLEETNDNNKSSGKLGLGQPLEAELERTLEEAISDLIFPKNEHQFQNDHHNDELKLSDQTREENVTHQDYNNNPTPNEGSLLSN